jgi:hypothetical protein
MCIKHFPEMACVSVKWLAKDQEKVTCLRNGGQTTAGVCALLAAIAAYQSIAGFLVGVMMLSATEGSEWILLAIPSQPCACYSAMELVDTLNDQIR